MEGCQKKGVVNMGDAEAEPSGIDVSYAREKGPDHDKEEFKLRISGKCVVAIGAIGLAAFYLGSSDNQAKVAAVLSSALEGVGNKIRNITTGSLLVVLHCYSPQSFLQFFYDYESGTIGKRLSDEFSKIGIEDVTVEIENIEEVKKQRELIRILSPKTLGFEFEQTGPYEPLTTRLSNILKDYKEGVGIIKELIQNADDAGASKVRFLVDWRQGPTESLFSPEMKHCQGPALWAYNDAVFTDKDFENINKLAGATKVEDLAKIGRFGLGFNAVYHLTDVPSFVSREYFVVFDPNVHHLQSLIKDRSRPGIRINLANNPRSLSAFEDQFQPYHAIFDCDTRCREGGKFYYDGTLFRIPFRTLLQKESKISQSVYNEEKVKDLLYSLRETAPHLLLYTQHVNQVELYVVRRDNGPEDRELELSVTKDTPKILRSENRLSATFIEECSNWWQKKLASSDSFAENPSRFELVAINIQDNTHSLPGSTRTPEKQELWLLTSCVGTDSSVEMASNEHPNQGLLPYAGAAVKISKAKGNHLDDFLSYYPESLQGEAFCFLPLSLPTGLPVHLNAYFAITSNRRGIWERDTVDHCQPTEVQWNECLMKDALANAYIQLLEDMRRISENRTLEGYDFHMLWPCYDSLRSSTWEILVKSLYDKMVEDALPLFCSDGKWLSIHKGYILDEQLQEVDEVAEILKYLEWNIFQLPPNVCTSLEKYGHGPLLAQRTLTLKHFLQNAFLPNIDEISPRLRDALLCHCLDLGDLGSFFKDISCISCSPDGRHLAKPSELIHPNGAAAILFSEEDRRFPIRDYFLTEKRAFALEQLGMAKDLLSWGDICGRAESVKKLSDFERSQERARNLIKYLDKNIENLTKNDEALKILQKTKFLPIKSEPPNGYFLPWKGSEHEKQFGAPVDLFLPGDKDLVGSSCLIVDDSNESLYGKLSQNSKKLLGFSGRHPEVKQVIQQLDIAISTWSKLSDKEKEPKTHMITSICKRVYEYFEAFVTSAVRRNGRQQLVQFVNELRRKPWLFIRGEFVRSEFVALKWNGNAAPFLYGLPHEYRGDYKNLVREVEIKRVFDESHFIQALYALEKRKDGVALTDEELKLTMCLLNELKEVEKDSIRKHVGQIPLPDTQNVLCRSYELTINLMFWLEDPDERYVHKDIPPQLALGLGAKSLQEKRLEPYSSSFGTPFGQKEKLTDRLANILRSHPCDSGILKELLQNADDAEATEIHFIHDTRVLPHERLFLKNAKEIQGPALCVYNNRPFTEKDFDGIQKLGIGSKGNDVEKTGQYGIGFNAVYHLTDCPSFLSDGDTLCFLDPECRYVPGATTSFPGRKFKPIDDKFKKDYPDLIPGYLSQHLKVQGGTVFRFPLRTRKRSKESLIAQRKATDVDFKSLLSSSQRDAKKMLLFLNHVKKITFSVVEQSGELVRKYEVSSDLTEDDEKRRKEFSTLIEKHKTKPTNEVPWEGHTYPMFISDSDNSKEKWLIHQCCGVQSGNKDEDIPDGRPHRFPRGGIAALLPSSSSSSDRDKRGRSQAYCLLPLPCYTSLPVHVNGHFALDSSRRNLWQDEHPNGTSLTRWNNFMKARVLAPGYVTLIQEAQSYIPYCEEDPNEKTQRIFLNEIDIKRGLHWYHSLFPNPSIVDKSWKILAMEVYRMLGSTRAPVLPVSVACEADKDQGVPEKLPHKIQSWLPAQEGFFVSQEITPKNLWTLLMRIGLPLLAYSPPSIHSRLKEAEVTSHLVSPMSVIRFLKTFNCPDSSCKIGKIPRKLENTKIKSIPELQKLITYCKKEETFGSLLTDLPLLLTANGKLKTFGSSNPVYCSPFSDLFPKRTHLFVHPKFVDILNNDDESTHVICKFTVEELARLLPEIFPGNMRGVTKHVPWSFPENGVMSEEWFRRLWEFLESKKNDEDGSLEALREWPVLPTMCGKLVTIDKAKTVLDMSESGTEIARERKVRKFLEKVKSPTLNKAITFKITDLQHAAQTTKASTRFPKRKTAVTDRYVGHPHTIADVLDVLDNMRKTKSLDVSMLPYKEILELLLFFQDEYENLQPKDSYDKILKRLPLYKTIDSTYVRLSASSSYAIVPGCIPLAEITELQRHTGCLFLHSDALPSLNLLYSALGVTGAERTVDSFYVEFILPFFNVFNLDSQMKFLTHVKEKVLPISHNRDELLRVLEETCCIPDEQGHLHYAKDFADPRNKVFRVMLAGSPNQFPPSLFHDDKWLDFLILIGLQEDVNKSQFLEFCNEVALANTTSKSNVERSKVLVQYLLTNTHLHTSTLLSSVSTIKFIASEKVEAELLAIHQQYQCREREEPPFVQFRSSVPWKKRHLVWTSAPLLPQWAQPEGNTICCIKKSLRGYLGVQENLTEDSVLKHLKDISRTLAKSAKEGSLPNPDEVKNIMTSIYKFLSTKMTFVSKDVSNKCTKVCKKIGRYLQEVPCVFLEESMVCVKGAQLSFTVPGESVFNPFLYTVPREYGSYQHFLKRLGATEQITPHQLVNILKAIKDQCQEGKMSSECKEKARIAMHILFELIVDNQALAKNTLLSELYLPSVDEHLIKSNQLICKVPPRLVQTVAKLNYNVLLSLDSCGLQRQRETDYLNALPETLRPIPLESLVREELDPSCKNNTCFSSRDGATCNFIKRYIEIMMCNEFREGIVRLIKHQQKSNELTDETMEKCSRLRWINTARFKVKCMSSIKIRLLNKVTGTVVEGTSMEHICYVVKGNDSWTLYVQHEFGGKNIRGILSKCVNEIMDNCLEENYIMMLTDMLTCNLPHDIADVLDSHDIDKDSLDGMMNPSKSRQELELLDEGSGGREGRGESVSSFMPVHYFPEVEGYTSPNHNEADRWMKQSRNDLEAAKYLLDANPPMFNALVCFLSHQIVEKTLKAVLYAKRGLTNAQLHTHSIHQLVNDVSSEIEGTRNVNMLAASVADYYLNTRYPNRQPDGRVPAEEFGVAEAESALKATDELVEILERFIVE